MYEYEFSLVDYKLREYEKTLAFKELKNIIGDNNEIDLRNNKIKIKLVRKLPFEKIEDLTFFSNVKIKYNSKIINITPRQVGYELTSTFIKNDKNQMDLFNLYFLQNSHQKKIRQLRYLTHLIHEYKGRYNPQLCKSLINISNIKKGSLILDPFVGSGTTLVECVLNGYSGIGLDINPFAYLLTKTKVESLNLNFQEFKIQIEHINSRINKLKKGDKEYDLIEILNDKVFEGYLVDLDYLKKWFPIENLKNIFLILKEIFRFKEEKIRNILLIALSDILKSVSFQDPKQLRIKRISEDKVKNNVLDLFLNNVVYFTNIIQLYQFCKPNFLNCEVRNYLGDIRQLRKRINLNNNTVDLIVTSPPYANALPYVDTDRLSLYFFGYVNREKYKSLEGSLIGNREISISERRKTEEYIVNNYTEIALPNDIKKLILEIYYLNNEADVGFRKKNTASLLYKYFYDMKISMIEMYSVLKNGHYCYMVIGQNRTNAGGKSILIPTDDFIGLIGEEIGFKYIEKMPINVQPSYAIHKNNAIKDESILVFKKGR